MEKSLHSANIVITSPRVHIHIKYICVFLFMPGAFYKEFYYVINTLLPLLHMYKQQHRQIYSHHRMYDRKGARQRASEKNAGKKFK
jgi:hypothetical protein